MNLAGLLHGLQFHLHRFADHRGGVSAIEFALVVPFMLLTYIGSVELADGLAIQFKATEAARTVTDLASQRATIDSTDMSNILGASTSGGRSLPRCQYDHDRVGGDHQRSRPGHNYLELLA